MQFTVKTFGMSANKLSSKKGRGNDWGYTGEVRWGIKKEYIEGIGFVSSSQLA